MKLRFTITDLLIFTTALSAYIAVVTQAKFILWHLAAASGMMGLLAGTVIGVCYGRRQQAVLAAILGSIPVCCGGIFLDVQYWLQPVTAERAFGLADLAICGAIPLASAAALFWRTESDILLWTTVNCLIAVTIPFTIALLFVLASAALETAAHPNKQGLFLLAVIIWLITYAGLAFIAAIVGVVVGALAIGLRHVSRGNTDIRHVPSESSRQSPPSKPL